MSYLVLARKYRPQSFADVVGQRPVVKTLQNSLARNRVAHAILFSGVRGVGKTTLARLMAKALNCEAGPAAEPCNQCLSCRQVSSGAAIDLLEIDGASNRGIQEVRELKDRIKYMPTTARYKVVIIDEVHMLTTEAFNALLKTLEEPPEHVYFMFATTELHKIPITILSRCQRYELQRVGSEELAAHFSRLAETEGIELEKNALALIVREAEGSVRDGLSLLDQVLSYGQSPITAADVVEVLGLVNRDVLLSITRALLDGNRGQAIASLSETFRYGMDVKRFMTDLLDCFRTLLLLRVGGCEELLDMPSDERETFRAIAQAHSIETIHQKLTLLMKAAEDLRLSLQPQLALETAFLAIIEAGKVVGVDTLLEKLDEALARLPESPGSSGGSDIAREPVPAAPASTTPAEPPAEKSIPAPEQPSADAQLSPPAPATENDAPLEPPVAAEPIAEPQRRDIRKDWLAFIAFVKESREWMAQNLQQAASVKERGQDLVLEFDDPADCTLLRTRENRRVLTEYVLDFFQKEYTIHIVTQEDADDNGTQAADGPKKRRSQLANNPLVRMTEEIFNGRIGDIRIGPPSR